MRRWLVPVLLLAAGGAGAVAADARPNIVFLLTDDQRWDSLGCTGNRTVRTPNIDRLAADGVLFEQASVTSAICTPSRASYFLGQFERRHGVNFNSGTALAPAAWAAGYPAVLRAAGYFTGYVGKNHVPVGDRGYAGGLIEDGFDFWYAAHNHLSFYPKAAHPIFAHARADTQVEVLGEGAASFLGGGPFLAGAKSSANRRPADRPFCLTVAFNLPHAAGTGTMKLLPSDPELYRTTYRDGTDRLALPPHYVPKADIRTPKLPAHVLHAEHRQTAYDYVDTEAALRERLVREYQAVTGIDLLVGRLRDQLAALGLDRNTVIVFASDHGVMHGEFGLGGKALNYEPCLRVPLIVTDPRLPADRRGRRLPNLVQSIDVAPTLLDLAGVTPPAAVQGQSLVPLLAGAGVRWREYAFAENLWPTVAGNPQVESVRSADWKYVRYFATDRGLFGDARGKGEGRVSPRQATAYASWLTASVRGLRPDHEELFHLAADPHEAVNLVADPKHAARLRLLRGECDRLVRDAKGDPDAAPLTVPLVAAAGKNKD